MATTSEPLSYEEEQRREVERYNARSGDLVGFDCEKCKNRGYIAELRDGAFSLKECVCMAGRRSRARLEKSGINPEYTLKNYQPEAPWQRQLLNSAYDYLGKKQGWFFIGGQVGCGKTHLCTGIVRELIRQGKEARYMLWRDESTTIKSCIKYPEDYANLVEPLKTVDVLYIDDFLKTNSGQPTNADFNLAFEILNARYNRTDLLTLLSSEFYLNEIVMADEAVGSRIFERANGHAHNIRRDFNKNYRLRGMNDL